MNLPLGPGLRRFALVPECPDALIALILGQWLLLVPRATIVAGSGIAIVMWSSRLRVCYMRSKHIELVSSHLPICTWMLCQNMQGCVVFRVGIEALRLNKAIAKTNNTTFWCDQAPTARSASARHAGGT